MAGEADGGKMRHVYGPRPLGALVPGVVRPAFRRRAPATAQVLADWEVIVGPKLAALTTPKRLFNGLLTVACAGPVALELQHLAGALMGRVNAHLGQQAVTRLRFVQAADPPPAAPGPPAPAAPARLPEAVATLPEGELRDALARLGAAVLTRTPR